MTFLVSWITVAFIVLGNILSVLGLVAPVFALVWYRRNKDLKRQLVEVTRERDELLKQQFV